MRNYSTPYKYCQDEDNITDERLKDVSASGKDRNWDKRKLQNNYLAIAYDDINERKAERLRKCSQWLEFKIMADNTMKLHKADFCRVRLCPICQWRRSLKTFNQLRLVVDKCMENGYVFIFVTLTIKNCFGEDLSKTLDKLLYAFNLLTKYKEVSEAWQGYFRSLEVTHNKQADTYHPHIHAMVAVRPSYFKNNTYISHEKLVNLWQRALNEYDYEPMVNVKRIKSKSIGAMAEVAKYAVKPSELIYYDDWDLTVSTVRTLDKALDNRRFIGMGGVMKQYHKELNLSDSDDGDLINTGEEEKLDPTQTERNLVYAWLSGYNQYRRIIT